MFAILIPIALATLLPLGCGDDGFRFQFPQPGDPGTPGVAGSSIQITIPGGATTLGASAFGANPTTVPAGTTVTWFNGDSVTHTVTSDTGLWDSGPIPPGARFARAFNDPGVFAYHSNAAPSTMRSAIQVGGTLASPGPTVPSPSPTPFPSPFPIGTPLPFPS